MKKIVTILICLCLLSTTFSYPVLASTNIGYSYKESSALTDDTMEPNGFWMGIVIGWAVGRFVLDPLWDKIVEVYEEVCEQVNDYFVALRRQTALEAEARRRFYDQYPDGQVIRSGSSIDGEYYYIPYEYKPIPY